MNFMQKKTTFRMNFQFNKDYESFVYRQGEKLLDFDEWIILSKGDTVHFFGAEFIVSDKHCVIQYEQLSETVKILTGIYHYNLEFKEFLTNG